jgi:hypothetical protein
MKKQYFFSFILAILSFITVKNIEKTGVERYHFIQSPVFQKENGWFDFAQPEYILSLPFELREISGVTDFTFNQIACVQDEDGIIYVYDLYTNSIVKRIPFGEAGDYEGLTLVDSNFYVLRSDASLFKVSQFSDSLISVKNEQLSLPSWNNEGLCYDAKDKRLLVAPKSKLGKGPEYKGLRAIYEIGLEDGRLNESPLFMIDVEELKDFAMERNLPLPMKGGNVLTDSLEIELKFMPSSLSVHPKTDDIYVISAVDQTMAVFDKKGTILNFISLDPSVFNKPEGITFLQNGDMIITNEGQMGTPTLVRLNWRIDGRQ